MSTLAQKSKIRLGIFIAGGLVIFITIIFIIGKQKNMFNPVFKLSTTFHNVSGLQMGSNIRFSGIDVGTVDLIKIINDSTVRVDLLIKRSVQPFIKADCAAAIGSSGIIGDRVLVIAQGSVWAPMVQDGQEIESKEPVETDAIIASLKVTADNAEIISTQLAEFTTAMNTGKGTFGRLMRDTTIAENINQTIVSLKKSSQGLNENMDAAKDNFLLKGFFDKKEKAAQKLKDDTFIKQKESKKSASEEKK